MFYDIPLTLRLSSFANGQTKFSLKIILFHKMKFTLFRNLTELFRDSISTVQNRFIFHMKLEPKGNFVLVVSDFESIPYIQCIIKL